MASPKEQPGAGAGRGLVAGWWRALCFVPSVPSEKNMAAQKNPLRINAVPPVPSVPSVFVDTGHKKAPEPAPVRGF